MAEYLEREALLKSLTQECKDCENNFGCDCEECDYAKAMLYISLEPTTDVKPVKYGKWLISSDGYYPYCSECKERPDGKLTDFCGHCGAKMKN